MLHYHLHIYLQHIWMSQLLFIISGTAAATSLVHKHQNIFFPTGKYFYLKYCNFCYGRLVALPSICRQ
jgi:hypothetical protein